MFHIPEIVRFAGILIAYCCGTACCGPVEDLLAGNFKWTTGKPVLAIDTSRLEPSTGTPWCMVKDPSIVFYQGKWHLFCTVKRAGSGSGRIRIGYMSFADWKDAQGTQWTLINLYNPGKFVDYHGAPQVFYFTPQKKWYLVYQLADSTRNIPYGPCYSTSSNISDPNSWTMPAPLYPPLPGNAGLDHWIICDNAKAYHFFTSLNGKMWRAETQLSNFPNTGWTTPVAAIHGDFLEASHTYKIKGLNKYLTVMVTGNNPRYYEAYLADSLAGPWKALAITPAKPFAGLQNVTFTAGKWAIGIDHGEIIRTGYDEKLEIDPTAMQFLFQSEISGGDHQLGLLTASNSSIRSIDADLSGGRSSFFFLEAQNPFRSFSVFHYGLGRESNIMLTIYNPSGKCIKILSSGLKRGGIYCEAWNGRDDLGRPVPAGIYSVRLTDGSWSEGKKFTFMK